MAVIGNAGVFQAKVFDICVSARGNEQMAADNFLTRPCPLDGDSDIIAAPFHPDHFGLLIERDAVRAKATETLSRTFWTDFPFYFAYL